MQTHTHFFWCMSQKKAAALSHWWWWKMIQESGKEGGEGLVRGNSVAPDVGSTHAHTHTHTHTHTQVWINRHTLAQRKTHTAVHVRTSSLL